MAPTSCYFFGPCFVGGRKESTSRSQKQQQQGVGGCAVSLALLLLPLWANNSALFKKYIYTTRHEIKG